MVRVKFYHTTINGQVEIADISYDGEKYTCKGNKKVLENFLPPESEGSEVIYAAMRGAPRKYDGTYFCAALVGSAKGGSESGHYGHTGLPGVWGGSRPTGRAEPEGTAPKKPAREKPVPEKPAPEEPEDELAGYEKRFMEAAEAGEIDASLFLGAGVNDSYLVTYVDDGRGVWTAARPAAIHDGQAEVMAYELDQILDLGVVPPTVYSELDNGAGTSQMFMAHATTGNRLAGELATHDWLDDHIYGGSHSEGENLVLLDHLILNVDRHKGNWMYNEGTGKLWAIDNGLLAYIGFGAPTTTIQDGKRTGLFLPGKALHDRQYTFSKPVMAKIRKITGDAVGTRTPEYNAFINKFSPRVRKGASERIETMWHSMVELRLNEGKVAW